MDTIRINAEIWKAYYLVSMECSCICHVGRIRKSGVDRDWGWDMGDGITYLCDMLNQRILMPY